MVKYHYFMYKEEASWTTIKYQICTISKCNAMITICET